MKDSRPAIFTPLVILGAGLIASLLMVGLLLSLAWLHPSPVQRPMGTAIINIIVASTNTSAPPIILPTETPDPTPTKVSAETLPQG